METTRPAPLPELAPPLLWLAFGVATVVLVELLDGGNAGRVDVGLTAASLAGAVTCLLWLVLVAVRESRGWGVAMCLGMWVPYLNLVLASLFARRYWDRGARTPGLLGLAALLLQSIVGLRLLLAPPPALL